GRTAPTDVIAAPTPEDDIVFSKSPLLLYNVITIPNVTAIAANIAIVFVQLQLRTSSSPPIIVFCAETTFFCTPLLSCDNVPETCCPAAATPRRVACHPRLNQPACGCSTTAETAGSCCSCSTCNCSATCLFPT